MFNTPAIAQALSTYVAETGQMLALRLDSNLIVTEINDQTRQLLGPDVVGRPMLEQVVDFIRPVDFPALIRKSDEAHRLNIKTPAGVPESVDFRFFPLPDGALALGSFDFQEQKKLREEILGLNSELNNLTRQLHQANAELKDLNQLKNQFLGMAAHDLRAPVGLIINYSDFVLDEAGENLSKQHREFLQICLNAAEDMQKLIESFLDLSVIESGHLQLQLEPTSVTEMMDSVGPIARLLAGKKNISLLIEQPTEGVPQLDLQMDAPKIRLLMVNLINNAAQHSQPGQRVWVSAQSQPQQVVFAVKDEGPGLTQEEQARLFQPFERAASKKTAGERSIGLGLAIARKVITAHGGRIWIESIPGQGSTFLFSVPMQEQMKPKALL